MRRRVRVTLNCVADRYAAPNERIIEFSGSAQGGLISFREMPDGSLVVDVYRTDPRVIVQGPPAIAVAE